MLIKKLPNKLIGEILVEEGYLDPSDLKKGLEIQKKEGGLIGDILVKNGRLNEAQLVIGLSKQLSLPFIHLAKYSVNREALKVIPRETAQNYLVFPFEYEEGHLSVSMANPLDLAAQQEMEKLTRQISVHVFVSTPADIRQAIRDHYCDALNPAPVTKPC